MKQERRRLVREFVTKVCKLRNGRKKILATLSWQENAKQK